jgi:hypothetical protein
VRPCQKSVKKMFRQLLSLSRCRTFVGITKPRGLTYSPKLSILVRSVHSDTIHTGSAHVSTVPPGASVIESIAHRIRIQLIDRAIKKTEEHGKDATGNSEMISFPNKELLSQFYRYHLKNDDLAEHTINTVTWALAGHSVHKSGIAFHLHMIVNAALSEYQQYWDKQGNKAMMVAVRTANEINFKRICEAIMKCSVASDLHRNEPVMPATQKEENLVDAIAHRIWSLYRAMVDPAPAQVKTANNSTESKSRNMKSADIKEDRTPVFDVNVSGDEVPKMEQNDEHTGRDRRDMISFPDKESLSKCYRHYMKDKYLAEKTTNTITQWLAGKTVNKRGIPNVAMYAVYDYQEYVAKSGNQPSIVTARMCTDMHFQQISNALTQCTVESGFYV